MFRNLLHLVLFLLLLPFSAHALRVVDQQIILDKLDDFKTCNGQSYSPDLCYDALERWVEAHRSDSFQAGKLAREFLRPHTALPFFKKALDDKNKLFVCTDEDIKRSVLAALDLSPGENKELIETAKKIGLEMCFLQYKDSIAEAASLDSYTFKNSCKELVAKKIITGLKAKKCSELK